MKIVIAGLGIIGGSLAKAIKKYTDSYVYGMNRSPEPLRQAMECGAIDEIGGTEALRQADVLILGIYPEAAVEFVRRHAGDINKDCVVIDTAGIKSEICPQLAALAEEHGFSYVGFHPMAGKEKSTYFNASKELIKNCYYFITPSKTATKEDVDMPMYYVEEEINEDIAKDVMDIITSGEYEIVDVNKLTEYTV